MSNYKLQITTSSGNKSWGQVSSCELTIFVTKSIHRDQTLVPATCSTNFNQIEILGQDLFLRMLRMNCSCDKKSLRPVLWCKLFMGLVAGTSRRD